MAPATQMAAPPPRARGGSFRVLRTARVAPSSPDGVPMLVERAVPLTFLDAIWLPTPPVDRVFFYRLGADDDGVDAVLSRLADSLSRALHLPDGGAVLAVQATVLPPARRGLALGVTVHHAACDGSSSTHFLHTWAAACAGAAVLPKPPVIDRTFIREREDLYDYMVSRTEESDKFRSPDVADSKLLATFTLSGEILQSIKDRVAGVAARRGKSPPPRCTSVVATFAIVWQCHIRAALGDVEADNKHHGRAHFIFPTDHRERMEPRVPDKYLGNCVGPCFASAPKEEIAAADAEDGLYTTCAAIAAAVDEGTRYDPDYWKRCMEHVGGMSASDGPPLAVAGSPRFRVYDVDFGFGRPAKVDVVSVAKTGAISVAEGRRGGIEVGVGLPPERMERFRRCFADAVAWLSSPSRPTNRYELFYQPGDAVAFTFAEHDDGVGVDELAADDPREVAKIAPLVPELPDGGAVLAVQAT
uniref:Uncharacterized protein n=1 Tax=Oryza rufipogon TaxID=4529 RepID=A0A0E0NEZ0_ORYRU